MPTDVIIEPGSGQIYWNDSAGSTQSISIKGDAQNTISVVGYSGAFSPGSSAGGTFVIASFNDNSGTSAFVPGTTNYDLGSTTYRWSVYGYTGNFSSDVVISSSTQSTSVTSGALRVNGGVGISGRMYFNTAAMGTTGIASPPTFAFIGSTGDPIYLQVLEDNSIAFEGSQGQLFSITPNLSTGYIYSVNDITGIPLLRANANANVTANEFGGNFGIGVTNPGYKLHVVGSVGFTSVTASTSPTTGTLVVSGGVGVGQTLNIGGRLNLWNSSNTNFTSFVSTATGNTVYNLPATTPATGSSVLQSDSVGNLSWVGFVATSAATATTAQNINSVVASTSGTHFILFSPVNGGSGIAVSSDSGFTVNPATNVITANTFSGNISATGTTSGFVGVTDATSTTSTTTGALVVTGGVGIGQSAIIGGRVGIGSDLLNAGLTVQTPSTSLSGIAIRGTTSQTADVFAAYSSTGTTSFSVSAGGRARLTGLDGIWTSKISQNIFDVSDNRVNWNLSTWQYSNIYWVTAGANIAQASGQLQIYNSGTTSVTGVGVVATGWDTGGATRVFGIVSPSGTERTYFKGYGNLVINPNNPNGLHAAWNTMDLITLDISGTATTYSGNIIKGSVEGTERFSVGPFGNTRITVGTATTATGFIVKAVASQTGNLIETQSSAGATNFYITPAGNVNVSSTTPSISSSTGALVVSGGVGIGQTLNIGNELKVQGTSASTSTTTGALVVSGGVGIAQTAFIGGNVNILGSTASTYMANGALTVAGGVGISGQLSFNRAAMGYTGIASNPTMAFIGTTGSPITLTVLSDNGLQFEGTSGKLFGINNNLSTGWIFNVGDISGLPLIRANADGTVAMGEFAGNIGIGMSNPAYKLHVIGSVGFTSVTASTNTTSGTLVVSGGVGIGQSLNVGGRLHLWNATNTNFTAFLSASTGNHTYTLPANVPSTGTSVLQADTSGVLSWVGFSANSASVANTAQNLNTVAATTSATHYLLFSPVNGASGVAVSSDTELSYNPSTNILSASVFSGNVSATAVTSTNFFGTLTGNVTGNVTGTSTTSQNVNTVAATTSATHFLTFSPVNGASGVALSSDANLTFNPATNVLTTDIFSGNVSATAVTSTNFFGTLTGNVTGNLTGTATTSQNINLAAGANNSNHSVIFSLNATGSGVALSSDAGLQYNPSTNVLTADVFSGNVSATAVTATNFFGTFQGSSATAVTSQNINTTSAATSASHYILFSPVNATTSGVAVSSDASLQFNPATNVLTVDVFSGNASGTAATFTNFFGTHVGNVTGNVTGTATTSQNVNTVAATTSASHFLTFSPVNGASGVALSSDANLTFNPSTNVLTTDVFSGNVSATAVTSTNFFGTLTGNVTGNLTGTATTAQNVNLAAGANASNHSVIFSLNATGTGIALSSDAGLQYNPSTNVLTADVFSGNVTGTAITATNFYGTHVGNVTGNVTGTATTSQNINTTSATTAGAHYLLFSPVNATASGVAVSSDSTLQFNPGTNVLTTDVFSGNLSATAATATNFFGTLVGNSSTATTAANMNVVAASTNSAHYITFSPASSGSGLATSADADLAYNPSTNVLTAGVFSGNLSATAATATNFFGTLVGNSSTATTATNVNLAAGANASNHSIVFSLNATGSGVALSSDAELQYNPSTNALSVGTGNITANSVRIGNSANTIDTSSGNLTLDSTGGQINLNDNVVVQGNLTVQGTTLTVDSTITTIVDPVIVLGSGVGGTHSTADNNQDRGIEFRYSNGGTAVTGFFGFQDNDYKFRYIPNATLSGTNVYSGTVGVIVANIEGNVSGTAVTATNFYGTLVGNTATATTSQNINTTTAATASAHYILFSPVNATASGVAVSSDSTLQFNPGTNVLTTDVFSGNLSATAATATNFFGTHVGPVTGNLTGTATTSQNINTTAATTAGVHYLLFSPVNATASGVAVSSDSTLQFNPGTNVLTTDIFSGNLSATAATATNFFGTLTGNVTGNLTGTATTAQNVNVVAATTAASHFITFSPASSGSGLATSADTQLTYNPATDVLSAVTFSGNVTGTAITATNFFGALTGNITGTSTTSQNVNTVSATTSASHFLLFSPVNGASGVAVSSDTQLTYNPATDVLSATTFSGNVSATAVTATNFFGTLVGNTATATTSQNINTTAATTAGTHYLLFSPVNATASGVAVSSDATLQFNPGTNVLTTDVFSGNLSATAATATNFFGTHVGPVTGNVTGTATTAINTYIALATSGTFYPVLTSVSSTTAGVGLSVDGTDFSYNAATHILTVANFAGNLSATAATATNFFGTLVGNSSTATTASNLNINVASTNSLHYITFTTATTGSGLASSTDIDFTYNPGSNVLTAGVFSGNLSGTAVTATNFFGALTGNVTGTATTAQNINVNATTINATHFITFSPASSGSGLATSTDTDLSYNPGSNVLTAGVFSGNVTGTAVTATNFFGTLTGNVTGNVTGTATTSQNVNTVSATTSASHFLTFSPVNGASGVALSSDAQLTYNPATDVLTAITFSGNVSGTAVTATNFFGTLTGNVTGTATTAQNVNVVAATTAATHFVTFSPASSGSGLATSADTQLTYNPATDVLSAATFSGNVTGTAITATNFFGTLVGSVGTATTSQNINTTAATTAGVHYLLFSPVNATASGVAVSSDATLQFNPGTNVLTTDVFSGNLSATAATATNFFGTLTGNVTGNLTGTATTAQNVNVVAATTAATHFVTFSPASSGSGLATSADTQLTYNPATDVLSSTTFSGNLSGTAVTATNFFGTLTGNVTGTSTTSQNINTTAATTAGVHYLLFSPVNATASGVAVSSDSTLQFNPGTNILTTDVFSGNLSATAATATNFFGSLTGNVTGTATTAQNINLAAGANNSNHSVVFSLNATGTGVGLSSDAGLQYNPSTNVLTADVFSGNFTGTAATATNFFGTHVGAVTGNVTGTATTSQNVNTVSATTSANHFLTFSPVNGASGVALSSDTQLTYNPATDVLSATTFSGNVTGTAITATNFFGTLVGSVGTATTSQNINTTAATTAGVHYLLFSPVNATTSGVAVSSDATLQFNPGTNVLTTDIFSGNLSATAATATNFFGTLTGNVTGNLTGTATTAQNINLAAGANNTNHSVIFSLNATGTGVGLSSDAGLQYNPSTNVLTADVFSGNFTGTAATATNFFGTHVGAVTGNVTGTATTSQNVNTVSATTSATHFLTFSPINGASGVALSSDAQLTYNPATDVLSTTTFSGNVTGTAITATNFFGTLTGNVTGNLTGTATTSQNLNTVSATTAGNHFLLFSPVNGASGVAVSSDATLQFNPATNVLTTDVFSGNVSGTAVTATNFFGSLTGNVTGTATTAQNINLAAGANNSNHSVVFSLNATGTGVGLSSDAGLQYNPSTNVLTSDIFSGNFTGTAVTATNFFGTLTGNVTGNLTGTATTAQNLNVALATTAATHFVIFSPASSGSGLATSADTQLTYNPATDVLSATTFSGNVTGTAITATNFYGTLVGSVGTATTSANVNTVAATTAGVHYLTFSPVNGASGVALSSDASLQFNPSINVLTTDIFAGNLSATAATSGFVRVSDLTNTTSSTTGALVVSGGVGIGGSINVDGTVKLNYVSGTALNVADRVSVSTSNNFEGLNVNSNYSYAFNVQDKSNNNRFTIDVSNNKTYLSGNSASHELRLYNVNQSTYTGFAASNSGTVTYILPAGDGSSGQVLATNGSARLYWSTPSAGSGGGSSGVNPGAQYQVAFYSATGSSVDGSTTFTNNTATSTVSITHATSSTATNVGALVVTGGLGLGGNAFIGGTVTVTNSTASNSTATGAVVITGGLGVGGQINAASVVTSGNAVISGNLTFNGNGTFGNLATADTIAFNARSTTDFNPNVTNTSDLGLNTLVWRNLFANFITGSAVTATNFYGTLAGNVTGTATTSQNINTAAATTSASHFLLFSPVNGATGVAVSSDTQLTYNPATDVLSATTFSGNVSGTAVTATNFFGTLTGNVTGTATTSQNINTTAATTAGAHYLLFSPVNATASGVAVSSDATLQFNPGTNVLTTDVFSGNLSATAATATNFFGTLTGNVTGTATTAQNVNTVSANTNATHFLTFSPVNGGSGVALSTDTNLTFNSLSNVMTSGVFSGNLSATAATSGLFAVGNLTYAAANLLAAFQSSVNGYNQVIIQNSNNGANASSDLVVNNDISTDTGAFGTFGMNSSGFTGLGSTNIPNAVYLTSTTSELVLGTTTNNRIRFVNENIDTFQITGTGSSVYTTTATLSKNSGAFVVAGGAAIGLSLSVGQGIQLYNSTNGNHTGFKAGATASNSVYTLPLAYPSTGSSILQSDTSGTMIWVNAPTGGSATPAGNNTELQYNNAGAFGGATGLTWQAVNNTLQINSNASHTTSTQVGLRLENGLASGGQATRWSPTFEMVGRSGIANVYFSRFSAEVVPSGPATYASALRFKYSQDQGTASYSSNIFSIHSTLGIGIGGSTVSSNFMSYIRAHESQAADISYKLPLAAPGTGASFLQCDTSGNMSWVNSPGGGSGSPAGSPKQIQFNNNGAFGGAGGFEYITVGGSAVTVSMFSVAGGGYTSGLWVNVLSASSTRIGIGLSNPQYELEINGELSATNKSFVINHPTKPGMKLRYGSLEGPENGVYVRGELKGSNIIEVPDHWIGLVHEDSYTVHLTPIGRYSQLYVEKIENYNVYVADNFMNPIHCYYSVWAERKDIPKLVTEY